MIILSEGTSTYLNFFGERFPLSFYIAFTCKIIIRSKIAMTILSSQYKSIGIILIHFGTRTK